MTSLIDHKQALLTKWRKSGVSEAILVAFDRIPRDSFIEPEQRDAAYDDRPLPIGFNQTISQPTTVITMLQLLDIDAGLRVLEIGAGSGFVCALLAELGCDVTGIEFLPELSVRASRILTALGYGDQVKLYTADGSEGWESGAPFDRILISAGVPSTPEHLFPQLSDYGILVAPVGMVEQRMMVYKKKDGAITEEDHGAYVFVPLHGRYGLEDGGIPGMPLV